MTSDYCWRAGLERRRKRGVRCIRFVRRGVPAISHVYPFPFAAQGEQRRDAEAEHRPCRRLGNNQTGLDRNIRRTEQAAAVGEDGADTARRELLDRVVALVYRIKVVCAVKGQAAWAVEA